MPRLSCTVTAVAGKVLSGVEVASTIRSMSAARSPALVQRLARRRRREVGGDLALRRDVALADAGALDDPLVGGVDHRGEVGVGQDLLPADSCRCRARRERIMRTAAWRGDGVAARRRRAR